MKKLFLLIPAMVLTLAMNAAVININNETADALRVALNNAADGDEIVMAAGTYVESNSNYIAFAAGKSIIVRAADGANVILKPHVPITIAGGARAEIKGIKIDASELCSSASYSHLMYPADNADNNRLILDSCEVCGFDINSSLINCSSDKKLSAVMINKCYFHNIKKSCLFIESTEAINISISNSTFANITTVADSYYAGVIDSRATSGSFLVDHCTFYNVQVMNTDYAAIGNNSVTLSDAIVSNCIFAMPESTAELRAIRNVATANNCLTYNYTKDSSKGIHSDVAQNNCIFADPLFADSANGDFSFAGNWSTMSISPARYAGTDGSDLGDPRWYSAEVLPSTSFATAYNLLGTKAVLSGRIELNASNKIHFKHNAVVADGTAKWKLHVGESCIVSALVDVEAACTSGRQLTLTVKDADGNTVATLAQPSATYNDADIDLGQIVFPEEGDYSFILTNSLLNSGVVLEKITLTYEGGAVQNIATDANTTLNVADAWFSAGGTRAEGKIDFPDGSIQDGWVKWNINVESTKYYDITVNIVSSNGHNYTVSLEDTDISVTEGGQTSAASPRLLGRQRIEAGQYTLKVINSIQHSDAQLVSVVFAPVGVDVTMDENDTDNSAWSSKVNDGNSYNVQIIRTIKAGMYNTICLPFAVTSEQAREIFGEDVQLRYLESATIEEGDFVLNLNFTKTSGMYPGTPHLIMTSHDIVNPVFTGVQFTRETPASTTKTNADFIGKFVKGTIAASENNLFMGANNTLYFPTVDTEILGMRAYFAIHDAPAGVIQRARIVEADAPAITTDINRVEVNASVKTIENGQLVIIRDGKKYNVMGVRIK